MDSTTSKKILVITGSAPCVLDDMDMLANIDVEAAGERDFMAIGLDAVDKYRMPILYVATYHPEDIPKMSERRAAIGGNLDYKVISQKIIPGVDIEEPFRPPTGSSAMCGALAGIRMGYRKIVLCGCPLTGNAPAGNPYSNFRAGWEAKKDELLGIVKSMSGWTRELLGKPSSDWLGE